MEEDMTKLICKGTNAERYEAILAKALASEYWKSKAEEYFLVNKPYNAPILNDELQDYYTLPDEEIGVDEIERRMGCKIAIEELYICPLSVNYLIFGSPKVLESPNELKALREFEALIDEGIEQHEASTIQNKITELQAKLIKL